MKLQAGQLIFWEISDLTTTKDRIADLGFEEFIPKNDYRAAMVKTLRKISKAKGRFPRKFNDKPDSVSFGVFLENVSGEDLSFEKEMIVHLDKKTGSVAIRGGTTEMREKVSAGYREAQKTLDAAQFRTLVLRIVKRECYGISMRKSGGIYFIDEKFKETMGRLIGLFSHFPECGLHRVPIYNDPGTQEAIEHAVKEDITTDIMNIVKKVHEKMKDGSLTRRGLEGKVKEADAVFKKIEIHAANLRGKLKNITEQVESAKKNFNSMLDNADQVALDPEDFMEELKNL
jgi:hypothetical protein